MTPVRAIPGSEPLVYTPLRAIGAPTAIQPTPARATPPPGPNGESPARATMAPSPSVQTPARAIPAAPPTRVPPARVDLLTISTLGALLDDLELTRIANGNRMAAVEREFGSSLPALEVTQASLRALEHRAQLDLIRAWRRHPLAAWAKAQRGVGEKSVARLIAIIGDPADRANPAKLWAYCGVGNPDRKRAKGMTQAELFKLGNPRAKKQVWLIATAFVKSGGPYRDLYDQARERYANRVHIRVCPQCHAQAGDPWKPGHQHAAALRFIGKAFLKALWVEARAGHTAHADQHPAARAGHCLFDDQTSSARAGQTRSAAQSSAARVGGEAG